MITDLRQDEVYCGVVDTFSARLIPTGSVGSDTLAGQAVTTEKIALLAVTTAVIAPEAVTTEKIAPGSVNASRLGLDILPSNVGVRMGTADPTTTTCPRGCVYLKYT